MRQTHQRVALAGLLALTLAITGCKSMHGGSGTRGSGASGSTTSGASGSYGEGASGSTGTSGTGTGSGTGVPIENGTGTSGSSGISGSAGSGTSSMHDDRGNTAAATSAVPNSTVLAIEALPQGAGITEGDSSMGTSGAAGATGSSGQAWRVTVRMDDGSTQVVNHSGTPDFRSGDRINVTSGAIQR